MNKFTELTVFIPKLKDDSFGEWFVDRENDGSPEHPRQMPYVNYSETVYGFENAVYDFCEKNPEYDISQYREILEKNGIDWELDSMSEADVSNADSQLIVALFFGAFRSERFCDGALLGFFENGSILKWLERLETLDNGK